MSLVDDLLAGDRRALARLITRIENDPASASDALAILFPHTGRAHIIGVTGAPGTGKSSLVNQMALRLRRQGKTVAILAVDPTSPFSGGAILGDRIRMRDLSGDPGVFIRSMASRGSLGGLARAAADTIRVMDAAGFDIVLIETVGAGQSEVEIARYAHTVVVVEAPGLGDDVQAIKAGILEIADVLAVNKADDPRARNTVSALRGMLSLAHPWEGPRVIQHHGRLIDVALPPQPDPAPDGLVWQVPIETTVALTGEGVDALLEQIALHRAFLLESGEMARRERARLAAELDDLLREALLARLLARIDRAQVADLIERIAARELSPHAAVALLIPEQA
ncbi:MAG: methylmalonyl Co-A mutase-associated GTPase MeaB [Anaerolineae bacterium]